MTNVLIPTDFSVNSLQQIRHVAQAIPGKISVFLFHAFDMPDSLLDAMRRTGVRGHNSLVTEDLRVKCKGIRSVCPNVSNISFRIMYGTTVVAFRNFAEANNIHIIAYPKDTVFTPLLRESVDPYHMFRKSGINILNIAGNRTMQAEAPLYKKGERIMAQA